MTPLRTALCLLFASLAVVACGADDSSSAERAGGDGDGDGQASEYSDAVANSLRSNGEDLPFTDDQIECLSVEFVDVLGGPDRLREAGVEPQELEAAESPAALGLELDEADAEQFAASFGECDIQLTELLLAEADQELPEEVRDCVEDKMDEQALADFFARMLLSDEATLEPPAAVLEPVAACFQR